MQKIPLQQQDPQDEPSSSFPVQALEILLLGSMWSFVLLWLPFYQELDGDYIGEGMMLSAAKAQLVAAGVLSACLLLVGRLFSRGNPYMAKESWLLFGIAFFSVAMQIISMWNEESLSLLVVPVLVVQAVIGLAFFIRRRT